MYPYTGNFLSGRVQEVTIWLPVKYAKTKGEFYSSRTDKTCADMYESVFAVLMVIALGILAGGGAGLLIGYAMRKQKPEWSDMTTSEKKITILLIVACSAIAIAGLTWYSLLR